MVITEKQRGYLFVLVGPGGAGKNAIMAALLQRVPGLHKLVTATTRPRRDHEIPDHDHFFLSLEQFQALDSAGQLLERTEVTPGKWYGILRDKVEMALGRGEDLVADIDVHGAEILLAHYPEDIVPLFITVAASPQTTLDILRQRMMQRGEAPELIEQRIERARNLEMPFAQRCQHIIVNADGQLEDSIRTIETLIRAKQQQRGRAA
jgi:guanylate kinase